MSHYSIVPPEPDPEDLRDSHADQFRRLIEEDGAASPSDVERLVDALAANGGGELSSDLALDLLLNEIVEQARLATGASGAAIALVKDGEMVCRATAGATAPDLGVRLDTRAGLSGACVETGLVQLCGDTETDPRVDAVTSRKLGVRSILVFPLLEGEEMLGVFEIFSPRPHSFGERDTHTLEALSRRILKDRQRAARRLAVTEEIREPYVEAPSDLASSDFVADLQPESQPSVTVSSPAVIDLAAQKTETLRPLANIDVTTAVLASLVIAAGIGLGVLIGWRSGAMGGLTGGRKQSTPVSGSTVKPAKAPSIPTVVSPSPVPTEPSRLASSSSHNESTSTPRSAKPGSAGGLVVFENGKEVFRMVPADVGRKGGTSTSGSEVSENLATLDADAANARLIHRVEPEYPTEVQANGEQGPVELEVRVGADGVVEAVTVVSGDPALANAALVAVRQWHYQPLVVSGRNTPFRTRVSLNFTPSAN